MTEWVCPRCRHDHTEPPWRAGDEDICNLTMGPLICGCTYLRRGPPPPPRLTRAEIEAIFDSFGAPKPPRNREVS